MTNDKERQSFEVMCEEMSVYELSATRRIVESSLSGSSDSHRMRQMHESILIAREIPKVFKAAKFFGSGDDVGHDSKNCKVVLS